MALDVEASRAFGIISGDPQDVAIAFTEQVAGYIRERTWHPSQTLQTSCDGLLLRLGVLMRRAAARYPEGA